MLKNTIFWDMMTSCGSCNNQHFEGIPPKTRFLQEPHGVIISQNTAFFALTAVKT
jgi:hypothetical protein